MESRLAACSPLERPVTAADLNAVAWCVSGRGYAPPSDTPRGLFPNPLMSTGTKTGEGSSWPLAVASACDAANPVALKPRAMATATEKATMTKANEVRGR